jgi:D-alanyl-lipoteichoic acid acyltransferase DltB (MBOAT superfamily)
VLFPTLDYLLFLPLCVLLYWATPRHLRLAVLAAASVLFYASWKLEYLAVLGSVVAVAWSGALWLRNRRVRNQPLGIAYAVVLPLILIPLVVFKYWNWLSGDFEGFAAALGWQLDLPDQKLPLPIGISFFTFQAIAYVIDVGRGDPAESDPLRFTTFIMFFPQLIAGPIVRGFEMLPQLRELPLLKEGAVSEGLFRIGRGMFKKLVLADILRVGIVDPLFTDPQNFTGLELLIGLYAYTLQIYYDFSAYTDIAIGSGRLFGFKLPENFRRPYKATNVTSFWRRWHITLSLWVRHYIYFPLGGARKGAARVYVNLMLTFVILGIWHGASWNFVAYGSIHGVAMMIHRALRKRHGRDPDEVPPGRWAWLWRWMLTFHFVVFARILFRAKTWETSDEYFRGLFDTTMLMPRFAPLALGLMVVGFAIHMSPDRWQDEARDRFGAVGPVGQALILVAVAAACLLLGTGEQLSFVYYSF